MANTYFTADVHFGHKNIITYSARPFGSVDEMDETIISNWNYRVRDNDEVWIIGDLMFCNAKAPEYYLDRFSGKKHLVVGNHDLTWKDKVDLGKYFVSVDNLAFTVVDGKEIVMCHYPLMDWPKAMRGAYMVYGHIHNNTHQDFFPLIVRNHHMLNADMDVCGFVPVTFAEMIRKNEEFNKWYLEGETRYPGGNIFLDERRVKNG